MAGGHHGLGVLAAYGQNVLVLSEYGPILLVLSEYGPILLVLSEYGPILLVLGEFSQQQLHTQLQNQCVQECPTMSPSRR